MKTLLFTLIFTFQAFAQRPSRDPNELRLSDNDINQKLVSVARDVENGEILKESTDLKSCRDDFQRVGNPNDQGAIRILENCLKGKIGTGPGAIAIADKLDLVTYNLIPSKTVSNVTSYLTKKLYLQLTGVDIDERDVATKLQKMKFNQKKQIDHKDFFDLYKNQIAKNVLYEVSRFCFIDLRLTSAPNDSSGNPLKTFTEHWANLAQFDNPVTNLASIPVTDTGSPSFESPAGTPASGNNSASYSTIMSNIFSGAGPGQVPSTKRLENFFFFCGKQINELCKKFEEGCRDQNGVRTRDCGATTTAATATSQASTTYVAGSKACLAKTRLTAFRSAMKASDKILEDFDKDKGEDIFLRLDSNQIVKRYERGAGQGDEKSLNELTNNASADFYKNADTETSQSAQDCIDSNGSDCQKFELVDDSVARINTNNVIVYEAKRLAEIEKVKKLVADGGSTLTEYIEKYYPDLKEMVTTNPQALEKAIESKWDAKRVALMKEIQDRIGERQITENEAQGSASSTQFASKKEEVAVKNAQSTLNEKNRLAQVVFFNNIISSSLELKDSSGTILGRNIQALDNEFDSAESEAPGVFTNLRSQLRGTAGGSGGGSPGRGVSGSESVTNIDFLDNFIGIPKNP